MKLLKKILLASIFAVAGVSVFAQQQSVQKKSSSSSASETSVENEYLSDIDGDIIISLANADDLDSKLVALQYLQNAIESGNTSDAVLQALDQLAGEGITTQTRQNGRLMNNFPEVRRQACLLMSKVPTEHSKNTLVNIALADNEPMVIAAAVKSLGVIQINNNDEVVEAIAFANRRNEVLNPTSSLALEVLNAYEALAPITENKRTMVDSIAKISVNYHYVTPVRDKAKKLLKSLSKASGDDSKKSSNSNAK